MYNQLLQVVWHLLWRGGAGITMTLELEGKCWCQDIFRHWRQQFFFIIHQRKHVFDQLLSTYYRGNAGSVARLLRTISRLPTTAATRVRRVPLARYSW